MLGELNAAYSGSLSEVRHWRGCSRGVDGAETGLGGVAYESAVAASRQLDSQASVPARGVELGPFDSIRGQRGARAGGREDEAGGQRSRSLPSVKATLLASCQARRAPLNLVLLLDYSTLLLLYSKVLLFYYSRLVLLLLLLCTTTSTATTTRLLLLQLSLDSFRPCRGLSASCNSLGLGANSSLSILSKSERKSLASMRFTFYVFFGCCCEAQNHYSTR